MSETTDTNPDMAKLCALIAEKRGMVWFTVPGMETTFMEFPDANEGYWEQSCVRLGPLAPDAMPRPDTDPRAFVDLLRWLTTRGHLPRLVGISADAVSASVGANRSIERNACDPDPLRALTLAAARALLSPEQLRSAGVS